MVSQCTPTCKEALEARGLEKAEGIMFAISVNEDANLRMHSTTISESILERDLILACSQAVVNSLSRRVSNTLI
jgi:hypothetical protein